MKAIAFLAGVGLASGQFLEVGDFAHYLHGTSTGVELQSNGVRLEHWNKQGEGDGFTQETLKPPAVQKITIPPSSHFPKKGTAYWLKTPATYVVTKGDAYFHYEDGTKVKLELGDLFYSPAGMLHGPIEAAGVGETVILSLGEFPPQYHDVPAFIPTAEYFLKTGQNNVTQAAFQPREADFATSGLPGMPECLHIAPGPSGGPGQGAIAVRLPAGCTLPYHFHPTGAFYFFTKGETTVGGDIPDKNVSFPPGTARWARPGWAYGPEQAAPESVSDFTWFFVLGQPPTAGGAPDTPDFIVRNNLAAAAGSDALQPLYINDQIDNVPKNGAKGAANLGQKRVHRHLRSSGADLDESVLLQQPMHDPREEEL